MMAYSTLPQLLHQRGTAVIAAMLITLAASATAVGIIERQGALADTLIQERTSAQAQWILRGALDWARVMLRQDAARNATTRADGVWAQPIVALPIQDFGMDAAQTPDAPQALLSGRIEDEQGKYNLRNLLAQGEIVAQEVTALQTLLQALDLPPQLADRIAQRLRAGEHTAERQAYMPGVRSLADLSHVPEMTHDHLARLHAYLTVLPVATPVNVNTASAEALSVALPYVSLAELRDALAARDRGLWFTQRADFFNRLGRRSADLGARITTRSDWFLVSAEVTLNHVSSGAQALLYRGGGQIPQIRWMLMP